MDRKEQPKKSRPSFAPDSADAHRKQWPLPIFSLGFAALQKCASAETPNGQVGAILGGP